MHYFQIVTNDLNHFKNDVFYRVNTTLTLGNVLATGVPGVNLQETLYIGQLFGSKKNLRHFIKCWLGYLYMIILHTCYATVQKLAVRQKITNRSVISDMTSTAGGIQETDVMVCKLLNKVS